MYLGVQPQVGHPWTLSSGPELAQHLSKGGARGRQMSSILSSGPQVCCGAEKSLMGHCVSHPFPGAHPGSVEQASVGVCSGVGGHLVGSGREESRGNQKHSIPRTTNNPNRKSSSRLISQIRKLRPRERKQLNPYPMEGTSGRNPT